jgi:hypoxanthine phosphoribosyltransferase
MIATTVPRPANAGNGHVNHDIDRILIDRTAIANRTAELAAAIRRDLEELPGDVEIVLIPVLTGALIFVADLVRHLPQKIRIGVLTASSYAGRTTSSSGTPEISDLPDQIEGKFVLIVDDVLDSGTTIRRLRDEFERRGPRAVRTCVLLRKKIESAMKTPCEYVGFDIPNEFVVGYGLDYNGYYRNLPDIGVLSKHAL